MFSEKELINSKELGLWLGSVFRVHERTVTDRWTKKAGFPQAIWAGGVRRWKREEVNKWIEEKL